MMEKKEQESLADYLTHKVFEGQESVIEEPVKEDVEGFDAFLRRYNAGLTIERAAVESLR